MVTLTIDGIEVTVEDGTTILEAAQQAGVRIPTLCHDKRLIPYGACRLCMVEVTARGRTRILPACFNPARNGMEVATHTEALIESRRMELMLLLRSHPLLCPSCDAGGNCRLQDLVAEYEVPELPFSRESRYFHTDNNSPLIRFNMNLCIRCGMCVRICHEVQGEDELTFVNRGMETEISTDFERPLNCEFCGQCAQVCPVGAISSKWLVGTGRDFEFTKTETTCGFCSLGCILTMGEKDGQTVWVASPPDGHNDGNLCVKGRYGWPVVYSEQRVKAPMLKQGDSFQEVTWEEALAYLAKRIEAIREESGAASLAALGSARLTNEEAYAFNRLIRSVIGTPHLDHAGGYAYQGAREGLAPILGYPAGTNPLAGIRHTDVILLLGADLNETHPVAKNEVILATGRNRARCIVIDTIKTKLTRRPGLFLGVQPGQEHLVAYAMLKEILDQELCDPDELSRVAEGLDELRASLVDYSPDAIASITGLDPELIRQAAREYAEAEKATIVLTEGMNRQGVAAPLARAAACLAVVTGKFGKESCGVIILGEKNNSQGALDMGLVPDLLPGFAAIDDETAREKFQQAWQGAISAEKGFNAREILGAIADGRIKGLYVVGENPLETYPESQLTSAALERLELLVVQDMFLTPTARKAHLVLPVGSFLEKTGTFTSAERRVQLVRPGTMQSEHKSDLEVFQAVAEALGQPMGYEGPNAVFAEIAELVEPYRGISYERLGQDGIHWPCVAGDDPGKPVLAPGDIPGGKARLAAVPGPQEQDKKAGFFLVPSIVKFHSGSMSQWCESLLQVSSKAVAEMNGQDMRAGGIGEGDRIRLKASSGATVELEVKKSRRALPNSVIVPQHFAESKVNTLVGWDEYPTTVTIEKA